MFKRGDVFVKGIDVIIRRDLDKHKDLLDRDNLNIQAFHEARSTEINRKRFYGEQKGKRNYDDEAMDKAIEQMNENIKNLSIKIALCEESKKTNTQIVDTLSNQLVEYEKGIKELASRQN